MATRAEKILMNNHKWWIFARLSRKRSAQQDTITMSDLQISLYSLGNALARVCDEYAFILPQKYLLILLNAWII